VEKAGFRINTLVQVQSPNSGYIMPDKRQPSRNCPFLNQPLPGCKVNSITSQTIPKILECCGDRYAECPLYLNKQACNDPGLNESENITS
jgi:hypothetical protein